VEQFLNTETLIIELLLVASLVAIVIQRLRIPYTVSLVVVGLVITSQQAVRFELTPELILALFVPPLVFEAAFHLEFKRLRENLLPIVVLAVPGVILTTFLVGVMVYLGAGLSLGTGLVFGALISATDPVAVVALFRSLGAPKQLSVLVESESLLNDGTSIVVFKLALAAALPVAGVVSEAGQASAAGGGTSFDLARAVLEFMVVAAGGLGIGLGLGWLVSQLIARIDDYLIETTLTTVLAFGAYLVAERVHVSGVLAVVGAGIVCGNVGPRGMSPTTRIVLYNFWEYLAFVANSLIFLLIGLDINIDQIVGQLGSIAIAVVAVVVSRGLVIYGLTFLTNLVNKKKKKNISLAYQHVLVWGGLRGAVSLALALSLPASFADREELKVMAYGVVLFTLLAQGTTMQLLLSWLGLIRRDESELEYERRQGRLMATRAASERVAQLYRDRVISTDSWKQLTTELEGQFETESTARDQLLREEPALQLQELEKARREGLRASRAMLTSLQSNGVLSESVFEELVTEIDAALQNEDHQSDQSVGTVATPARLDHNRLE
jgi:CPA1 family monovalent cation:H+ antiporter